MAPRQGGQYQNERPGSDPAFLPAVFNAQEAHLDRAILCSFLAWSIFLLGPRFFRSSTVKIKEDEHIRGVRLITEEDIAVRNDGSRASDTFYWGV